jgi:Trk-type K+ transport system membrane component
MEFDLATFMYTGSVPVIMGIVQAIKGYITDTKWTPLLSLGIGIIFNVALASSAGVSYAHAIVMGLVAGLMACGAYSIATVGK